MAEKPVYAVLYTKEQREFLSKRTTTFYKNYTQEEREELKREFKQALTPYPPGKEHSRCDFCLEKDHNVDTCPKWDTFDEDVVVCPQPNKPSLLIAREIAESKGIPLKVPHVGLEEDHEEIKRLMKRRIPPVQEGEDLCKVCYSKDHDFKKCPCLDEIPEGVKDLSPRYNKICNGCRRIDIACCSKGMFAHRKWCDFCREDGHWYWEEMYTREYRRNARKYTHWMRFKEGKPYLKRPLVIPRLSLTLRNESEEVLKLRERKLSAPVTDGFCEISYAEDHRYYKCEWLIFIPENMIVGPGFDVACFGCGKIGQRCCGVGAYVTDKLCLRCFDDCHLHWEEACTFGYVTSELL